jgi:hypothetical protein
MVKPKYPKQADVSQLARLVVEHATGVPSTSPRATSKKQNTHNDLYKQGNAKNRYHLKKSK